MPISWERESANILGEGECQYPGRGRVPISWERESANILGEGECQYPGRGRVPISWERESATILGEGECHYPGRGRVSISWRQQQENWKEKWKWQPSEKVVCMFFNHYINVCVFHGIRSFRVETWTDGPGETGKTLQKKVVFMLLFPREIQGIKWKIGNFLIWSQTNAFNSRAL